MNQFTTGQVRRLFKPVLRESQIRLLVREAHIEPSVRVDGRYLWTCDEIARIATLVGRPVPDFTAPAAAVKAPAP